jgi:phage-related minor tail protein
MTEKSSARSGDSSRTVEKGVRTLQRLEEIKELVCAMSQSTSGEIEVEVSQFKTLLHRLKGLEREMHREED